MLRFENEEMKFKKLCEYLNVQMFIMCLCILIIILIFNYFIFVCFSTFFFLYLNILSINSKKKFAQRSVYYLLK